MYAGKFLERPRALRHLNINKFHVSYNNKFKYRCPKTMISVFFLPPCRPSSNFNVYDLQLVMNYLLFRREKLTRGPLLGRRINQLGDRTDVIGPIPRPWKLPSFEPVPIVLGTEKSNQEDDVRYGYPGQTKIHISRVSTNSSLKFFELLFF